MAKNDPIKKIKSLMDTRQESIEAIENLNNIIEENTESLRKQITELTKEDEAEIVQLQTSIGGINTKIEKLMKENEIQEFPHESAYLKLAGSRTINVQVAKAILSKTLYARIAKATISVTTAEKILSPTEFAKVVKEAKASLKFLKPKKDIEEVSFRNGVKSVVK